MKTNSGKKFNALFTAVVFILIIAAVTFTIKYLVHSLNYEETNDAQVESYINPVSARVGGYIQKINFEEHQQVKKGDTLVIIDNREFQNKISEAEADLEDAKARLQILEASINAARTGTSVNKDLIYTAKAKLLEKQQDLKRYKNLIAEEAVTVQEFEQMKAKYDVASSEYNASENTLKTSNSKITELEANRGLLQAQIKEKEARLEFAKINLAYTIITAPYSGQVGRKSIQEGQQIQAGQSLMPIINESQKWVTANFKETQIQEMHVGQAVKIVIDGFDGRTFEGKIEAISGSTGSKFSLLPSDNSTGNFVKITQRIPVKISFSDKNLHQLKAGMNVTVSVKK